MLLSSRLGFVLRWDMMVVVVVVVVVDVLVVLWSCASAGAASIKPVRLNDAARTLPNGVLKCACMVYSP
jgi:hypothetical protein